MKPIDSTDAEIDAFDTVCRRLGGFVGHIDAEWVDGYLTALAAGPRAIGIEEWLPALCGDAFERTFADPEDEAQARSALLARMRVLANHLDPEALLDTPDELRLQPLVSIWDDAARAELIAGGAVAEADAARFLTGGGWAEGFFQAVDDFADDWRPHGADADALAELAELLAAVSLLAADEESDAMKARLARYNDEQLPTREDLIDEACFAVQDLRVWWLDHAPRPPTRHVPPAPGRNDPCPCGSGRKFKKCHGR